MATTRRAGKPNAGRQCAGREQLTLTIATLIISVVVSQKRMRNKIRAGPRAASGVLLVLDGRTLVRGMAGSSSLLGGSCLCSLGSHCCGVKWSISEVQEARLAMGSRENRLEQ